MIDGPPMTSGTHLSLDILVRVVAILLLAASIPNGASLLACTCATERDPLVALGYADAVFNGTVSGKHDPRTDFTVVSTGDPIDFRLRVTTIWKGPLADSVTIRTKRCDASCGFPFEIGESYLIYANQDSAGLHTHLCTRTQSLERAGRDLDAFARLGVAGDAPVVDAAIVGHFAAQIAAADSAGRIDAVRAIGRIGKAPAATTRVLERLYASGSVEERSEAVTAFCRLRDPKGEFLPFFYQALSDSAWQVRTRVAYAVSRLEYPEEILSALLRQAIRDPIPQVRESALSVVGERWPPSTPRACMVPDLVVCLQDTNSSVRAAAARALAVATKSVQEAAEPLLAVSEDPSAIVRGDVIRALGRLEPRSSKVQTALLDALTDSVERVQREAAWALRTPGPLREESVEHLLQAALDPSEEVARTAVDALAALSHEVPSTCDALPQILRMGNEAAREQLVTRFGSDTTQPTLIRPLLIVATADASSDVRYRAYVGLDRLGPGLVPDLTERLADGLDDPDYSVRRVILHILARMGPAAESVIPRLERAMDAHEPYFRGEVQFTLDRIKHGW